MNTIDKTETLGAIVRRQAVVPTYLREMLEKYGPKQTAVSHTAVAPFGSYLLGVSIPTDNN